MSAVQYRPDETEAEKWKLEYNSTSDTVGSTLVLSEYQLDQSFKFDDVLLLDYESHHY